MVQVTLLSNGSRPTVVVSSNMTLRQVLEQNRVDYSRGMTNLDGYTLQPGDLDKSFDEFGIKDKCYLSTVVKADNSNWVNNRA